MRERWRRPMTNSLVQEGNCSDYSDCCTQVGKPVITTDFNFGQTNSGELFPSELCDIGGSSRITLKGVSNTSGSLSARMKVTLVHSSTMSTTWSGGSPRVVSSSINKYGHREFGFDFLNQIPRGHDLLGWIDDFDSFIKDQQVGLQEQKVGANDSCCTDGNCCNQVATVNQRLNNKAGKKENQNPATSCSGAGSELFNVCHSDSFSQIGSIK